MGQTLSEPVVDKVGARPPRPRTAVKTHHYRALLASAAHTQITHMLVCTRRVIAYCP